MSQDRPTESDWHAYHIITPTGWWRPEFAVVKHLKVIFSPSTLVFIYSLMCFLVWSTSSLCFVQLYCVFSKSSGRVKRNNSCRMDLLRPLVRFEHWHLIKKWSRGLYFLYIFKLFSYYHPEIQLWHWTFVKPRLKIWTHADMSFFFNYYHEKYLKKTQFL